MKLDIYLKSGAVVPVEVGEYSFANASGDMEFSWTDMQGSAPALAFLKLEDVSAIVKTSENEDEKSDAERHGNWAYGVVGDESDEFNGCLSDAINSAVELSETSDYVIALDDASSGECLYLIYGGMIYSLY